MLSIDMTSNPAPVAAEVAAAQIFGKVVAHLPEPVAEAYSAAFTAAGVLKPIGFMEAAYAGVKLSDEDLADDVRADLAKVAGDLARAVHAFGFSDGVTDKDRAFEILSAMRRHLGEDVAGDDPEVLAKFLPVPAPTPVPEG